MRLLRRIWGSLQLLGDVNAKSKVSLEKSVPFKDSGDYWKQRYIRGGTSGVGSYGKFAEFKAEFLNDFVAKNGVSSVIEFGCGDGNQLKLAKYPMYTGIDISSEAIALCRDSFEGDQTKCFVTSKEYQGEIADLSISLDVIYHLVEDHVFQQYMVSLFDSARRYVIVYSSNFSGDRSDGESSHVRHRKFTDWVTAERPSWQLEEVVKNKYPYNGNYLETSFSDFYVFKNKSI